MYQNAPRLLDKITTENGFACRMRPKSGWEPIPGAFWVLEKAKRGLPENRPRLIVLEILAPAGWSREWRPVRKTEEKPLF